MGDIGVEGQLARLVARLEGTVESQEERLILVESQLRRLLEGSGTARLGLGEEVGASGIRRASGSPPTSSYQSSHHSRLEGNRTVAPSFDVTDDMPASPAAERENTLKEIYKSPYQRARKRGAITGSTLLGLLALPFGPVGMASSAIFGALVGGAIGHMVDRRIKWMKLKDHEKLARKLRSLVRWAWQNQFDEDLVKLVEIVTSEFKPVATMASGSRHARHLLRQLDAWISQKRVTRELWAYMDGLLRNWRSLGNEELVRKLQTLQTLQVMYKHTRRQLDEEEVQFVRRMDRLLEHEFVQDLVMHAKPRPNDNETRMMESMAFADTIQDEDELSRSQSGSASVVSDPAHAGDADGSACRDNSLETGSPCSKLSMPYHVEDAGAFRGRAGPSFASGDPEAPAQLKLKRPFFMGWKDFLDFDTVIKHKMPVTLSEFDLLLEKEEESLQNWDVCVDREEIKVAKIQFGPNLTLRAWATVPGVDMVVAFHLFYSHEMRMKWDKTFATMRIIQEDVHGSSILYSLLKVPTATPRDFLQYRRVQVQSDGSILLVLRSAEHTDMPEDKRYIRAESFFSGYVLRQTFDGDRPTLKIFLTSCLDIKGMVPKWIVNYMAPKAPKEWVDNLRKAAVEYQERNPGYKQALARQLDAFKEPNPFDYEPKAWEEVSL